MSYRPGSQGDGEEKPPPHFRAAFRIRASGVVSDGYRSDSSKLSRVAAELATAWPRSSASPTVTAMPLKVAPITLAVSELLERLAARPTPPAPVVPSPHQSSARPL